MLKDTVLYVNLIQNLAYMLTGFVNPGIVRMNERVASTTEELFLCRPCNIYTRPATRHCTYCNACIRGNLFMVITEAEQLVAVFVTETV